MPRRNPFLLLYCGVAVAAVGTATLLRGALDPLIGKEAPFLFFFIAVLASACSGGLLPGLLATALSALAADFFFLNPEGNWSLGNAGLGSNLLIGLFLLEGGGISWLTDLLRAARRRAEGLTRAREQALAGEQSARAASAAAEQRCRDLIDGLDAIVWEADPAATLCFTFVSQMAETMLGYPVARWLAEPEFLARLVHPDDREQVAGLYRTAAAKGKPCDAELRAVTADGRAVWLRCLVYATGPGRPLRGLMVDITARKEIEEQLRRREQELEDFFENAVVGLHWVGPDGRILRANRAELDLLGYSREEYVGRPVADFHADPEVIADILRRLQAGETLRDCEARLRCKDGSIRHVLIDSNVRWEGGRFVHTRCFTRDVTERKRAEEALKEADRRKDGFLAMLSHELRNPLAPIRNAVHLLRQSEPDDPALAEARDVIDRQVQQLAGIVDDLLDVFKITHNGIILRREALDLVQLVRRRARITAAPWNTLTWTEH